MRPGGCRCPGNENLLRAQDEGPAVWEAGFGSLYWMEGVVVRLQDRRGGTGQVLNVLRVNNDNFCDLAALALLDDRCGTPPPRPVCRPSRAADGVARSTVFRGVGGCRGGRFAWHALCDWP